MHIVLKNIFLHKYIYTTLLSLNIHSEIMLSIKNSMTLGIYYGFFVALFHTALGASCHGKADMYSYESAFWAARETLCRNPSCGNVGKGCFVEVKEGSRVIGAVTAFSENGDFSNCWDATADVLNSCLRAGSSSGLAGFTQTESSGTTIENSERYNIYNAIEALRQDPAYVKSINKYDDLELGLVSAPYKTHDKWEQASDCLFCGDGNQCDNAKGNAITKTEGYSAGVSVDSGKLLEAAAKLSVNAGYSWQTSYSTSDTIRCTWQYGVCHTYWIQAELTAVDAIIYIHAQKGSAFGSQTDEVKGMVTMFAPTGAHGTGCGSGCCGGSKCNGSYQPDFCQYATPENEDSYGTCTDWNARSCTQGKGSTTLY